MLLHFKISTDINITLKLRAKLSLNRDWFLQGACLTNAFFLFRIYHGKIRVSLHHVITFPRISYVKITLVY